MEPSQMEPIDRRVGYALAAFATCLLFVGLNRSGIWDPWEIDIAEVARHWSEGQGARVDGSPLGPWLASVGFRTMGVREWTGRVPLAAMGLLTLGLVYLLGRRHGGRGTGVLAVVVCATSPLFLINSRLMLGASPHFALQTLVGLAAAHAAFTEFETPARRGVATAMLMGAVGLATWGSGALLGPLPVLLGISAATLLDSERRARLSDYVPLWVITGVVTLLVWRAVRADAPEYSAWLGGGARGGQPPSFEREIERLFHNFAPWSALLVPALGGLLARMVGGAPGNEEITDEALTDEERQAQDANHADPSALRPARGMGVFLIVWFAASYAATTLFASRYGAVPVYAVAAVAVAVALTLVDLQRSRQPEWVLALLGVLFTALLLRDYAMFPGSPITGTPGVRATVPEEGFSAKSQWAAVCALFALGVGLSFLGGLKLVEPTRDNTRDFVLKQWRIGAAHKVWWVLIGLVALGITLFGALTFVIPDRFNSLAVRVGHYLVLVVPGLLLLVWSVPRLFNLFSARHSLRVLPICVGGLVFGAYFALGFMPELSRHLSPRDVFETYNTLRGPDEVLGEFQAGGRAGGYYTDGEVRTLESLDRVVSFLTEAGDTRVWAVFPADQLVEVNQRYRTQTQEHLFVADARNARMLLATNQPIEGRDNENVIARSVLRELPRPPQHPMNVSFGGKVELIGYDLELPAGESVGPSQSFAVTWYWRALQPNIGGYKIFLHIDGHGKRLNGDHDPVEERYPVSRWQAGDIVLDRQELDVGADYPPGNYTMWIGFYAGSSRLPLTELSTCTVNQRERCKDTANRLNAGQLVVR